MRYIDAEKIEYHELSVCGGHGLNCEYTVAYKHEVDAIPTADVVQKSEVIDEFVERLKEQPIKCCVPLLGLSTKEEVLDYFNDIMLQVRDAMDKTVKEMIGGAE
jgi:hypothetical protein